MHRTAIAGVTALVLALVVAPRPAGATTLPQPQSDNSLTGVSCATTTSCVAVGTAVSENNQESGEIFDDLGGSWTAAVAPSLADGLSLDAVSCSTGDACLAIGESGVDRATALNRRDGAWSVTQLPQIRDLALSGVTCSSSSSCWAVGWSGPGARSRTTALVWNGHSWRRVLTPNPSARYPDELNGVSCVSARDCWAVGEDNAPPLKPTITSYLFALHWNGSRWTRQWTSAPFLGGESSQSLSASVSCADATRCWIAGASSVPPGVSRPLLYRLDGRSWTPARPPTRGPASLQSISCPSRTRCVAVGSTGRAFGDDRALTLTWDGGAWVKAPAAAPGGGWTDVSCAAASSCVAVGSTRDASRTAPTRNLAEQWNGGAWSTQ